MADDKSLKERAADWLFTQGVSTVLLFAMLALGWYYLPDAIRAVNNLTTEINQQGEAVLDFGKKFEATGNSISKTMESQNKILLRIETGQDKARKEIVSELKDMP